MNEHDEFCNCEDCWWGRGQKEVCSVCGCVHDEDCDDLVIDTE